MKKILNNIGCVIATLLMFAPLVIVCHFGKADAGGLVAILIVSICYDIYMFSNIEKNQYTETIEEKYQKIHNQKKVLGIEVSDKDRILLYEDFIEEIIDKLK